MLTWLSTVVGESKTAKGTIRETKQLSTVKFQLSDFLFSVSTEQEKNIKPRLRDMWCGREVNKLHAA